MQDATCPASTSGVGHSGPAGAEEEPPAGGPAAWPGARPAAAGAPARVPPDAFDGNGAKERPRRGRAVVCWAAWKNERPPLASMGLFGATGVGVGAIVGGGILALAGVAFAATGPAALARLRAERRDRRPHGAQLRRDRRRVPPVGRHLHLREALPERARGVRRRLGGVVRVDRRRRALRPRLRHVRRARPPGGGARRPGPHAGLGARRLDAHALRRGRDAGLLGRPAAPERRGRAVDQRGQDPRVPRGDRRRRVGVGPYARRGRHGQPAAVLQPAGPPVCSRRWASPSSRCRAST